jgi:hypothetical protein
MVELRRTTHKDTIIMVLMTPNNDGLPQAVKCMIDLDNTLSRVLRQVMCSAEAMPPPRPDIQSNNQAMLLHNILNSLFDDIPPFFLML